MREHGMDSSNETPTRNENRHPACLDTLPEE